MGTYFKKITIFLLNLILCINLIGCTKKEDLNERAIVAGIGIDKAKNEEIELTLQIVNPTGLGIEQEASTNIGPIWVNSTTGKTVYEAVREQLKMVNRRAFYSHVQILVIGEELAKEGIADILDFFARDYETRLTPSVLIARGTTGKEIISLKSSMEPIPAMHLKEILEDNKYSGSVLNASIFKVLKELNNKVLNNTIGAVEFRGKGEKKLIKDAEIEGTAVFKEDKLIGWLDKYETAGLLYIKDEMKNRVIGVKISLKEKEEEKLVIEQVNSKGHIETKIKNGKPIIEINIKAEGIVGEQHGQYNFITEKGIKEIEKAVENIIKDDIKMVVNIAQNQFESDIFGFGDKIRKRHLTYWNEVKDEWDKIFPEVDVKINIKFKIRRSGLTGPSSKDR